MDILNENEKWVSGCEGRYSVTTEGKVFSFISGTRKELSLSRIFSNTRNAPMYMIVGLSGTGGNNTHYVHRLVAETFIPNPDNKPQVNHIDGDKTNNSVENLEWVTKSENILHSWKTGLTKGATLSEEEIRSRMFEALISSKSPLFKKYLTDEFLIENNVPPEVRKLNFVRNGALPTWNYYVKLFRLCDNQDLTLENVAKMMKIDQSMVSLVRSGKRAKKARRIYDKYKDDPHYFKRYNP